MLKKSKRALRMLVRLPGFLWSEFQGPRDTIQLIDDDGKKLGITIRRLRKSDKILIKGLGFRTRKMSSEKALEWAGNFMDRAAALRGVPNKESPVDQHKHMMRVSGRKTLSVRNTIRLGFAIEQIINNSPTYFTQESTGGLFTLIDMEDYAVPDIRLPPLETGKTAVPA